MRIRPPERRQLPTLLLDGVGWVLAIFLGATLRFEFDISRIMPSSVLLIGFVSGLIQVIFSSGLGLYEKKYRSASFDEFLRFFFSSSLSLATITLVTAFIGPQIEVPRSVPLIAGPIYFLIGALVRVTKRIAVRVRVRSLQIAENTLIYGGGAMAEILIPQLQEDPTSKFVVRGVIDDNPEKLGMRVAGVKVLGSFGEFERIAANTRAQALIIAIPRANSKLLQAVRDLASSLGIRVLVIPTLGDILRGNHNKLEIKELQIEDLIGRQAVSIDAEVVEKYLRGATVLVTGAGGSIGLELCRQVSRFSPSRLVMLDRDETALQQVQLAVEGNGLLNSPNILLADIRDRPKLIDAFSKIEPDVVFHAAALKHLPALEKFPEEAWKTNVEGTLNVLQAANLSGVKRFVNISTDKAADPTSKLGLSKNIAEGLTSWFGTLSNNKFLSVRFGNVLGSRGSLVPTLAQLINENKSVTITDPAVTRYFMTVEEACQLVLQAGAEEVSSATLVLDMGEPVKIVDIAKRMIAMSGKRIDIQFSGLRPGEKLHEALSGQDEHFEHSRHDLIWRLQCDPISPTSMKNFAGQFGAS